MTKSPRQKIQVACDCGTKALINCESLNINIRRNGVYLCHHCATKKAGAAGKYSHTAVARSMRSKAYWQNPEYRQKITTASIANNTSADYREAQKERTVALWTQQEYANSVSVGVSNALADTEVRQKISDGLRHRYIIDPNYRVAVGQAARSRFCDQARRLALSLRTKRWWQEHRDELMQVFTSAAHRDKLSAISTGLWQSQEYANSVYKSRDIISRPQQLLYELLDGLKIDYFKEGSETFVKPWSFDCRIPYKHNNRSLLIEVQSYWHTLTKQIARDQAKFTYINKYFPEYDIMYVWDYEFAVKDRTIDRLLLKLGQQVDTTNFEFKDISIRTATSADVRSFLDCYHYIGKGRGGKCWAAYHNEQLVACVVISKSLRQNIAFDGDFRELSRFCIHPRYHKKNFGSWLIAQIISRLRLEFTGRLIAYADTTLAHRGTIYQATGFVLHHTVPSDYWYIDDKGFVMHKKTLYNRAVQLHLTESDFADQFGFQKKWGGEKLCFTKTI